MDEQRQQSRAQVLDGTVSVREVLPFIESDRYLTLTEASKYLGISKRTISDRLNEIPHYRIGKRVLLFKKSELVEWLLKDDSSFPFWCHVYGANPTSARQELCKAIKARPVKELAKEIRIERITQALTEHPELSNRELGRRLKVGYEAVRRVRKLMPQVVVAR